MLGRISEKLGSAESRLFHVISRINGNRYLYSVRHGFTMLMPLMIMGSLSILLNNFPVPGYDDFMGRLFGTDWRQFGSIVYIGTFTVISMAACLSICYHLITWYNNRGWQIHCLSAQLVSFASVMIFISTYNDTSDVLGSMGVNGLFMVIIVTILSGELFCRTYNFFEKRQTRIYTQDANISFSLAMSSVMPALITISFFVILRIAFQSSGVENLNASFNELLQRPFVYMQNTPLSAIVFSVVTHIFWIFGIHGNNVLDNVASSLYVTALGENAAAVAAGLAPNFIFTKSFFDAFVYMGGSGSTLCLVAAILLFSNQKGVKRLARIGLVTGIFNINEPIMYGLPIVLNPVYILPFLLTPLICTVTSWAAMAAGLVPLTVAEIAWTTPIFLSGLKATGSVAGVILQIVNFALGVAIYFPFIRIADGIERQRFINAYNTLNKNADVKIPPPTAKLLSQTDEAGAVARQLANDLGRLIAGQIEHEELHLNFQPLVDIENGRVFGCEALLRWTHPTHGPISPVVAIALAEDTGLIGRLGRWIINTALSNLKAWRDEGHTDLIMYVNISMRQLEQPDFADYVIHALRTNEIPFDRLEFEVTESVALSQNSITRENIDKLHQNGVRLALDDFGMGHSSLLYLQIFPSSTIKVDESLTANVEDENSSSVDMVRSIVMMCDKMGMELIAERVETKSQLDRLAEIGCHKIQGYYFSRPLLPEDFLRYASRMNIVGDALPTHST